MKIKIRGFLLLESMVALTIAVLGVSIFSLCLGQGKVIEQKMEGKVDQELAAHIMRQSGVKKVVIHDHSYLAGVEDEEK